MNNKSASGNGCSGPGRPPTPQLARSLLANWRADQPKNYFTRDVNLQRSLEFHWGTERYGKYAPSLIESGAKMAEDVDRLAAEACEVQNLPRLVRYDRHGERIEQVVFHPSHHEAGRLIYGTGMMSAYGQAGQNMLSLCHFYLSAQNGEAGHNCSAACTAGLIKALQAVGDSQSDY